MRHETAGTFYRRAHVLSPAFVTALIVACTTLPRTQQAPRLRVDTTFVFVADSGSSTTFPLLTERPRAERFLADPDPPPCAVSAPPDTSEWRVDTAPGNFRYIQRITLLLPTAYEPFDRQHLPDRPDTFRETGAYWEHSLGSWWFIKPDATPAEQAEGLVWRVDWTRWSVPYGWRIPNAETGRLARVPPGRLRGSSLCSSLHARGFDWSAHPLRQRVLAARRWCVVVGPWRQP